MSKSIACVGFVLREDYPDMIAVCDDMPNPPVDFDTFNRRQIDGCNGLAAQGVQVVRVNVKPLEMAAWCKANGKKVDGLGRAAYAAYVYTRLNK